MMDVLLLRAIRGGSEKALGGIIDKYTAYVCAIIRRIVGERMTSEDVEEIASDVFLALWKSAGSLQKENLKAYLGAIARNKAKNKLRVVCESLPLEEESIASAGMSVEEAMIAGAEQQAVKAAILGMDAPDREIFLRHYYGSQTVAAIVAETGMTESAVKHRLVRGREKIRFILDKEGFGK
ncbi:MAG: sigma-70 family RNA polymerase sigma factor [Peptococcaceae bacterium]|jgi:RNA polymerase sigma-70 factor (ECF subfamily)|nr:sigma-70 family RNA polymerase sigma factor [Peptococcaceae bacterium]